MNQTQLCVIFIVLWWSQNISIQTPQSYQFLSRSLVRSSPTGHESWEMTEGVLLQEQAAEM